MGFGFIGIILMLVVAVVLIRALFPQASRLVDEAGTPPVHGESALDTARRRYAAGEIDKEEFEAIRRELSATKGLKEGA